MSWERRGGRGERSGGGRGGGVENENKLTMPQDIPRHCGTPPRTPPSFQKRFIAITHSATDETWMAQVGSESALAGSGCGGSKTDATGREARRSQAGEGDAKEPEVEEGMMTSAREPTTRVSSAATAAVASFVSSASVSMAAEA